MLVWVSIGSWVLCVMSCLPSRLWRFDMMACGVGFDLLLSRLSFILICKLENSSPLFSVSSLKTGKKNCLHQDDYEKTTYSECWLGPGQWALINVCPRRLWLLLSPGSPGSPGSPRHPQTARPHLPPGRRLRHRSQLWVGPAFHWAGLTTCSSILLLHFIIIIILKKIRYFCFPKNNEVKYTPGSPASDCWLIIDILIPTLVTTSSCMENRNI